MCDKRVDELECKVAMLVDVMTRGREELRACQAVIHLSGDFDPRYVSEAQAMMKQMDAAITADAAQSSAWLNKKHVEWLGKPIGEVWFDEDGKYNESIIKPIGYFEKPKGISVYAIQSEE